MQVNTLFTVVYLFIHSGLPGERDKRGAGEIYELSVERRWKTRYILRVIKEENLSSCPWSQDFRSKVRRER